MTGPTAADLGAGLRKLAALVESFDDTYVQAIRLHYCLNGILVPLESGEALAHLVRRAVQHGATATKDIGGKYAGAHLSFGCVGLRAWADREQICRRVVTGTREVTETVPDPDLLALVPTIEQTRIVEDVEWVCEPLLAAGVR